MREIKFRAWGCRKGINPERINGYTYFNLFDLDGEYIIPGSCYIEKDTIIEQYTGLKDKNGKEIYEGDIIKVDSGYGGDHEYTECFAEIRYCEEEACFYPYNPKDRYGIVMQDYSYERDTDVIGNIHQNPELVK